MNMLYEQAEVKIIYRSWKKNKTKGESEDVSEDTSRVIFEKLSEMRFTASTSCWYEEHNLGKKSQWGA